MRFARVRRKLIHLSLLPVVALSLWTVLRGIDFGYHWDEDNILNTVSHSIDRGVLVPGIYNYPSVTYYLPYLALVPDLIELRHQGIDVLKKNLSAAARRPRFRMRARTLFALIGLMSIIWIYVLVFFWRRSWMEALLAASLIAMSWEVNYHARWVAPDVVLMQFSALALMLLVFFQIRLGGRQSRWLWMSAVAAGLACGTKYPAGVLLLAVFVAASLDPAINVTPWRRWRVCLGLFLVFSLTYVLTTPGMVLEPFAFYKHLARQFRIYGQGPYGGYTMEAGLNQWGAVLTYLFLVVFSKYPVISAFVSLLVAVGIYALVKEDRRTALVILLAPLFYVAFFTRQSILIVRNFLFVVPFLAVLAARGAGFLQRRVLHRGPYRYLLPASLLLCLGLNASWLIKASETIVDRRRARQIDELVEHVKARSDETFVLTRRVARAVRASTSSPLGNIQRNFVPGARAVFYLREAGSWHAPSNKPGRYTLLDSGPYEVNLDYYATWRGDDRIVIAPAEVAAALGLIR